MKKQSAIRFLALGLTVAVGYLAWCSRPFFLRPDLEFDSHVAKEMRDFITAWDEDMKFFKPEPFSWENFGRNLMKPNGVTVHPARVLGTARSGDEAIATHSSRRAFVTFRKDEYGWFSPMIQCSNPPSYKVRAPAIGY